MIDETKSVTDLHSRYCYLTGLCKPLTMESIAIWRNFIASGFTSQDLDLVVAHLKRKIKDPNRLASALRFRWFIRDVESFGEDLAEARALARAKPVTNRDRVLAATGRPREIPDNVKTSAEILAMDSFKEFCALKDKL